VVVTIDAVVKIDVVLFVVLFDRTAALLVPEIEASRGWSGRLAAYGTFLKGADAGHV
jgi:hypothetical protein